MYKVFLCIPTLVNAGAQRFVTELACNIEKSKYEITVITTNQLDKNTAFYKQLVDHGIAVEDVSADSYKEEFYNICALLKRVRPNIVHTNVGSALHMLLPVLLAGKKVRHIFTVHSMGYRIFSSIKKKLMQIMFHTKRIIPVAICDTVKKSICDAYKLPEQAIPCIYNGVDTEKFLPKNQYCKNGVIEFVSVGTLYALKNHTMLIDAFNIVRKQLDNVKLTIVGGGELYDQLQEKINHLHLEEAITLAGDSKNVSEYLLTADIYCCPSKVEGLPITVLEAMSTGLPIITTPAGGVVDIVKEGINGYIVSHGSPQEMAEKMIHLATNRELLEKMGEASRQQALNYDERLCARGYEKLYAERAT